ncbi:hypothetical protein QZH41_007824 [Actinostola sp. cb2023]|nr:hypothetical protein QZH41_007824 [Actinostola sp. cb2023]
MESLRKANQSVTPFGVYQNTTAKPPDDKCIIPFYQGTAIVVINLLLVLVGTFGNFLIIFAVLKTPRLRQRVSNFLLLSLAVADLMVTMCAQPLHATSMCFKTFRHYCIAEIDFAYDVIGNFSFFCSIFHLSAISIDRALAATKPYTHQDIMKKRGLKIMLCTCWGSAVVFVCVRVPLASAMMLSIAMIFFNYAIIIISYVVILYKITRDKVRSDDSAATLSCKAKRDARMEKRVSGTISIVILIFSICCLPLVGFYLSVKSAVIRNIGSVVYMWIRTLALSNSSMNFIVYSFRIYHFRVAYLKMLRNILQKPRELLGMPNYVTSLGLSHESKISVKMDEKSRTDMTIEAGGVQSAIISKIQSNSGTDSTGSHGKEPAIQGQGKVACHDTLQPYSIPGHINCE